MIFLLLLFGSLGQRTKDKLTAPGGVTQSNSYELKQ